MMFFCMTIQTKELTLLKLLFNLRPSQNMATANTKRFLSGMMEN